VDPATGKQVVIKDGRFGPYITDGETNATVPRSVDPLTLSVDRAFDLLAERRAAGPPAKRTAKRSAPAKKATKRTARKPAAKKSTARKPAGKKASAATRTATIDDES
jgi:DNA topoisomerase-1